MLKALSQDRTISFSEPVFVRLSVNHERLGAFGAHEIEGESCPRLK